MNLLLEPWPSRLPGCPRCFGAYWGTKNGIKNLKENLNVDVEVDVKVLELVEDPGKYFILSIKFLYKQSILKIKSIKKLEKLNELDKFV